MAQKRGQSRTCEGQSGRDIWSSVGTSASQGRRGSLEVEKVDDVDIDVDDDDDETIEPVAIASSRSLLISSSISEKSSSLSSLALPVAAAMTGERVGRKERRGEEDIGMTVGGGFRRRRHAVVSSEPTIVDARGDLCAIDELMSTRACRAPPRERIFAALFLLEAGKKGTNSKFAAL